MQQDFKLELAAGGCVSTNRWRWGWHSCLCRLIGSEGLSVLLAQYKPSSSWRVIHTDMQKQAVLHGYYLYGEVPKTDSCHLHLVNVSEEAANSESCSFQTVSWWHQVNMVPVRSVEGEVESNSSLSFVFLLFVLHFVKISIWTLEFWLKISEATFDRWIRSISSESERSFGKMPQKYHIHITGLSDGGTDLRPQLSLHGGIKIVSLNTCYYFILRLK